jgi:hypothetical protein
MSASTNTRTRRRRRRRSGGKMVRQMVTVHIVVRATNLYFFLHFSSKHYNQSARERERDQSIASLITCLKFDGSMMLVLGRGMTSDQKGLNSSMQSLTRGSLWQMGSYHRQQQLSQKPAFQYLDIELLVSKVNMLIALGR